MKNLATIETISEIIPHPNADRLTIYKMDGLAWQVVSAEQFEIGSKVIYIQIDTIVPNTETFKFLENKKWRVNPIRLRGEWSNGLILPFSLFSTNIFDKLSEMGVMAMSPDMLKKMDVTDIIGIKKYEKPVPLNVSEAKGNFPTHLIPKTDESRLENYPSLINDYINQDVYVSLKSDGSSLTCIHELDGTFRVCSRNLELKEDDQNKFWHVVNKYNLKSKLPKGFAIQGELIGQGIQGNSENISGLELKIFNVWELSSRKLYNYDDMNAFCTIPTVDTYYVGKFKWNSVDEMIQEAQNVKYTNGKTAEGLVWRLKNSNPFNDKIQKELSVKTINYNYKD